MQIGQWEILFFVLFKQWIEALAEDVKALKNGDPEGYRSHPKTKLLAGVYKAIFTDIPANPNHPNYRATSTFNKDGKYTHWKRAKKGGIPNRYRLFFTFRSAENKIVYVWINDEQSLRKAGSKRDPYNIFVGLVKNGTIPNEYLDLIKQSSPPKISKEEPTKAG